MSDGCGSGAAIYTAAAAAAAATVLQCKQTAVFAAGLSWQCAVQLVQPDYRMHDTRASNATVTTTLVAAAGLYLLYLLPAFQSLGVG